MSSATPFGALRALVCAAPALALAGCGEGWVHAGLTESVSYEASAADDVDAIVEQLTEGLSGARQQWLEDVTLLWSEPAVDAVPVVLSAIPAEAEPLTIARVGGPLEGDGREAGLEHGFRVRRADPARSPAGSLTLEVQARYRLPASERRAGEQALALLRDRTLAAFARQLDLLGRERGVAYRLVDWKGVPREILVEHLGAREAPVAAGAGASLGF